MPFLFLFQSDPFQSNTDRDSALSSVLLAKIYNLSSKARSGTFGTADGVGGSVSKEKVLNTGKRNRNTSVYADISGKEKIRTKYKEKQGIRTKENIGQKSKGKDSFDSYERRNNESKDAENEEYYCPVCMESYRTIEPSDKWIQCIRCKN